MLSVMESGAGEIAMPLVVNGAATDTVQVKTYAVMSAKTHGVDKGDITKLPPVCLMQFAVTGLGEKLWVMTTEDKHSAGLTVYGLGIDKAGLKTPYFIGFAGEL
jgi:hypothetical protein